MTSNSNQSAGWCVCLARLLGWIFRVKHSLRKWYTHNKLHRHLLSTWLILMCRWRWKTFRKLLCFAPLNLMKCLHNPYSSLLPPRLYSLRKISTVKSDQTVRTHVSEPPIWKQEVTAAVTGNSGCKSADNELIKCAWPLRRESWMDHAPLSLQMPSGLDFNA